jgi:hypothetical protein
VAPVRLILADGSQARFAVHGGFVEVSHNHGSSSRTSPSSRTRSTERAMIAKRAEEVLRLDPDDYDATVALPAPRCASRRHKAATGQVQRRRYGPVGRGRPVGPVTEDRVAVRSTTTSRRGSDALTQRRAVDAALECPRELVLILVEPIERSSPAHTSSVQSHVSKPSATAPAALECCSTSRCASSARRGIPRARRARRTG